MDSRFQRHEHEPTGRNADLSAFFLPSFLRFLPSSFNPFLAGFCPEVQQSNMIFFMVLPSFTLDGLEKVLSQQTISSSPLRALGEVKT